MTSMAMSHRRAAGVLTCDNTYRKGSMTNPNARFAVGDVVPTRELATIHGEPVAIPDPHRLVHLQFRRYSGCPVCSLHLRSFSLRHQELVEAGIREVVLFHSPVSTMLDFQGQLPFDVVADPGREVYDEFGVGNVSIGAALDPRSWRAAARALTAAESLRGPTGKGEEHMGAPADFLIGPSGEILTVKYGKRVDDHWSVDEVLAQVADRTEPSRI